MSKVYFVVARRYVPMWIHGWLGKIQWNITTESRFLESLLIDNKYMTANNKYMKDYHKNK